MRRRVVITPETAPARRRDPLRRGRHVEDREAMRRRVVTPETVPHLRTVDDGITFVEGELSRTA